MLLAPMLLIVVRIESYMIVYCCSGKQKLGLYKVYKRLYSSVFTY